MNQMTKQLRWRFIIVSMLAVFLIVSVFVGAVNITNYVSYRKESAQLLQYINSNGGSFDDRRPGQPVQPHAGQDNAGTNAGNAAWDGTERTGSNPAYKAKNEFNRGDWFFGELKINDETHFRLRFFTVSLDESDRIDSVNVNQIATVDDETALQYAKQVLQSGKESGTLDSFVYERFDNADGNMIVFLERFMERENLQEFLLQSLLIAAVGLAALFLIIYLVSPIAIAPFVRNMEKQKRFITDASHEIKTPIAIISANADALSLTGNDNEFVQSIKHQTVRLTGLVGDLVTLSKLDEHDISSTAEPVDFSELVTRNAEDFSVLAEAKGKSLTSDVQPDITVAGDPKSLERLVIILLDNAVKYAPENGAVTVLLTAAGKEMTYSVSNLAPGMSKDDVKHVFDRFWRADASRDRRTGGYGIGLSLAKAIAENAGGTIQAKLHGEVITFSVRLPV